MSKKIKTIFQTKILPFLLYIFIVFVYFTSRKKFILPKDLDQNDNFVIAFWHGALILAPFTYKKLRPNKKVTTLISEHRDGQTISNTVKLLGIDTIKGSSTRGGIKALVGAIKAIKRGIDVAITPDGPKGPKYSIADGIIVLAQKSGKKIISLSFEAKNVWRLNSWDNFVIPKPFNEIIFYASKPLDVKGLDINTAKKRLKTIMKEY